MKFNGYGIIWNPKKNKKIVNFKENPDYETNDPYEIEILSASDHVTSKSGVIEVKEPEKKEIETTKKDIMALLDEAEIDYNPRDKKEVLIALLEG